MDYKFGSKEKNKKELIRNELKYWEENPAQKLKLNVNTIKEATQLDSIIQKNQELLRDLWQKLK
ncbi:hypothetical protein [Mesomycoplasma ovipneumoniae]|uniref:hypothetical protein n=1 Tax=Mesomycoplasma ovipneumoniae TaxID=29562 RepID=UPI003080572A